MNETLIPFLLQYGIPGLVILGMWHELQAQKKEFAEREKIWIEREKLWHEAEKKEREILLETIDRNTEILAKLQLMDRYEPTRTN